MRCIVMGAVESTRICLRVLEQSDAMEIAAVVTLPPTLYGRHSDFIDLGPDAARAGARLIYAANCNEPQIVETVGKLGADYLFVIGWSQIAMPALRAAARLGAIGFHPAPLPRMRGRAVIPWTILLNEKITGSTLFWLDDGVDSGPIIAQRFYHLAPDETATSLYVRHLSALEEMLTVAVLELAEGNAQRQPQDERYATWCAKRRPADGLIDWLQPVEAVARLVRAVTRPYPGAFTCTPDGSKLVIWTTRQRQETARQAALAGQVVDRSGESFAVRCGDGRDLQVEDFTDEQGQRCAVPRLHLRLGPPHFWWSA